MNSRCSIPNHWRAGRCFFIASHAFISLVLIAAQSFAADKLRISYASVSGNTAVVSYIAHRAGLYAKYGLDSELILITGGPAAVSALINGDVDVDLRAPVAAIQAMAQLYK